VSIADIKGLKRCTARAQAIRNDHLWLDVLVLQQPPQKSKCCSGIASLRHDQAHHRCFQVEPVQAVSTCMRSSHQIRIDDEIRRGNLR
jgi:hypothetical protein